MKNPISMGCEMLGIYTEKSILGIIIKDINHCFNYDDKDL